MKIITKDTFGKEKTYEVVNKIPKGFFIWNIGENMGTDEYIPICEALNPNDKDDYSINPNTVKAIKLSPDEVKILRKAAGFGITSKKAAEMKLKRKPKSTLAKRQTALAEMALPILEAITD